MNLSIIVPIYNVDKYLEKCLNSIYSQVDDTIEVILVNDGSTDGSARIAESFANIHSNTILISQENQGLSMARNNGFKVATGKYIWFVDSDDWLPIEAIKIFKDNIREDIDVYPISYSFVFDYKSPVDVLYPKELNSGKDMLVEGIFNIQAQFYIYKKDFLIENKISFFPGIYHEDFEFTPRMLYYAGKTRCINKPMYMFYKRENSISTVIRPKRAFDYLLICKNLYSFANTQISVPKVKEAIGDLIGKGFNNGLKIICQASSSDMEAFIKQAESNVYLKKCLLKTTKMKYKIEGILLTISTRMLVVGYKYLYRLKIIHF